MKKLTKEQFHILREKGTEPAFSGKYWDHKKKGIYVCAGCGAELFSSEDKFDSGTGWPSFSRAKNVDTRKDFSHMMIRTEVLCKKCRGHLGHVFGDGPEQIKHADGTLEPASGKRFCINSLSLDFKPVKASKEKATFGAGCFWGIEDAFMKVNGVVSTVAGYMGGIPGKTNYEKVCSGKTGHAEVVQVEFDPSVVSYGQLLDVFWKIHNPKQLNRQGPDVGTQYLSVIFYHTEKQKKLAEKSIKHIPGAVTEIKPAQEFHRAEEYHQQYLKKQGHKHDKIQSR